MKKIKNKVFSVIFLILTIFLISILVIFNSQNYSQEANNAKRNLIRMDESRKKENNRPPDVEQGEKIIRNKESKIFIDSTIYTVILNKNSEILEVINHTTENIKDEEIKEIAKEIIKNDKEKNMNIGNLYLNNYSYAFTRNNTLIIMDTSNIKGRLLQALKTSIFIFIILEAIIIFVTKKITSWIIKPIMETVNKQKQFIADASHELKTPLSVIIASAEALENEPKENKWLNNIKNEADRMNHLITDLLEMAKSENTSKEQYTEENLSKIIEKSVLTFESLIYEKDINFNYNIEENIKFLCNGNQIKQLIGILLDNAIKHSSRKGEIKVNTKKEKGNIILTVTNKGEEIPKEEQEKIFERFYRVDESRNRQENRYGLGLAIAKNIVENHNGEISAKSQEGYTTFKVILK